jgi:Arc/MetJ-type ribon-helix-helix transcriptional regulator
MPFTSTITASSTPELPVFNAAKLAAGRYSITSEVARAALYLLDEKDHRDQRGQRNSAEKKNDAR